MPPTPDSAINVLQILPNLDMGGVEQGTLDIAQALIKNGFGALILTQSGQKIPQARSMGATVFQAPMASKNPLKIARNIQTIMEICQTHKVSVIHARSRAPAWSAFFAAKHLNLPFVTTFHGTYNFSNDLKRFYNSVMVRGHTVIAISDFIKNHILQHYNTWVTSERIKLIHRGVDCDYFDPMKIDLNIMKNVESQWQLPQDQPMFLMPGRLTAWKGQQQVIQMLPFLKKGVVVFLGSHQGRQAYGRDLERQAHALGITHRVRFIDGCTTMREAYALCQGVIHASTDPEAFGRVIAEAQAMGKPVIASPLGAPREIILDTKTGWLCDPNDPQRIASYCDKMCHQDLTHLAHQARNRVLEHFSLTQMAEKTLDVYRSLI